MIREAQEADSEQVAAIYNYYIANTTVSFEEEPVAQSEMAARIAAIQDAGYSWLVAEHNSRVVGYAYAGPWNNRCAYRDTAEVSVYLAHEQTGAGWGTRLYKTLFEKLRHRATHAIVAGIALPNTASIALHEKFGMQQVAQFKEVGFKFGERHDVAYWQTFINRE